MNKTILAKNVEVDNKQANINRNIFIEGASGSGKTRYVIKPNIMNCNDSFVVVDPKGDLYKETSKLLEDNGYEVKVLNLYNPKESDSYNPLKYIKNSQDVKKIAKILVKKDGQNEYWSDSATNLLEAILYFLLETKGEYLDKKHDINMRTVKDLVKHIRLRRSSREDLTTNDYDTNELIGKYCITNPESDTASSYSSFSTIIDCSNTASCIIHDLTANLSIFDNNDLLDKMNESDFDFTELKKKKCAYFVIVNDSDCSLYPLISLFYQQIINELFEYSDNNKEKSQHVNFIFDDAFTNVKIENLDALISNCRSRNISFTLVAQSRSQLESLYNPAYANTIISNCSFYVFLGTNDLNTADYHARRTNKKINDIMTLDLNKCIVYIQGQLPRFVDKYDIKDHQNYKYLIEEERLYK